MKVKIIEPHSSGHRLYYVRILAESLPAGSAEWLTTREAADSAEARIQLGHLISSGTLTCSVLADWSLRRRILDAAGKGPNHVVVPDGDHWLTPLAGLLLLSLVRPMESTYRLLLMRPLNCMEKSLSISSRARRLGKYALVRTVRFLGGARRCDVKIFSLMDAFGVAVRRPHAATTVVSDPVVSRHVPSRESARQLLGVSQGSVVVGLLGVINARKNPRIVAAACANAFEQREGQLLVLGMIDKESAREIEASGLAPEQLVLHDSYATEEDLVAAARACDVIALLYDNHDSSSGLLSLAAQAGVPVIVPQGSVLAQIALKHGFGVATTFTSAGMEKAIELVVSDRERLRRGAESAASALGTADFSRNLLSIAP